MQLVIFGLVLAALVLGLLAWALIKLGKNKTKLDERQEVINAVRTANKAKRRARRDPSYRSKLRKKYKR